MKRVREATYLVPVEGKWSKFTDQQLECFQKPTPWLYHFLDDRIATMQKNPLAFFLPHGKKRDDAEGNDGRAALNNFTDNLILVTGGNQVGKSRLGAAFTAFRIVPCDPDWPCFKEHGLTCPPWTGPKEWVVASDSWDNVGIIWRKAYQYVLPRHELMRHSRMWGIFEGERGVQASANVGGSSIITIPLSCRSEITLLCYTQKQAHFETRQADGAHDDEQIKEEQFEGLDARMVTRGDYTPIIMTLTGVVIPDRPTTTGGAGWVKKKLFDKTDTKGRTIATYCIPMDTVPDEIYSPQKKEAQRQQWIIKPRERNDERAIRIGEARVNGGWEFGSGLVLDEWNPLYHVIEPFDVMKYNPTLYRMIDHGEKPCAALLIAVFSWGDAVAFAEYYEYGRSIWQNAKGITEELSKNERRKTESITDSATGRTYDAFEEIPTKHEFASSELDTRSFGRKSEESDFTIGNLYNLNGCECRPSTGSIRATTVPLLKDALTLDAGRIHINKRLKRDWPDDMIKHGAPRLYIFSALVNTRQEIEGWPYDTRTDRPKDGGDHLISCMLMFAGRDRAYLGPIENEIKPVRQVVAKYTGY